MQQTTPIVIQHMFSRPPHFVFNIMFNFEHRFQRFNSDFNLNIIYLLPVKMFHIEVRIVLSVKATFIGSNMQTKSYFTNFRPLHFKQSQEKDTSYWYI